MTTQDEEIIVSADVMQEPPPEGRHPAICIDVIGLGAEEENWEGKITQTEKLALVWQVYPEDGARQTTGLPFQIDVKVSKSINNNSRLRLMLESWRAKPFTADELKGFNLSKLKGAPCHLNIIHKVNNGTIYANLEDTIRDDDPRQQKFSKVEPCTNGKAEKLKAEPEHYDREAVKRRYQKMRERRQAQASEQPQIIPPTNTNDPKWVPF